MVESELNIVLESIEKVRAKSREMAPFRPVTVPMFTEMFEIQKELDIIEKIVRRNGVSDPEVAND